MMREYTKVERRLASITKQLACLNRAVKLIEKERDDCIKQLGGLKVDPNWKKIAAKAASKLPTTQQLNIENPNKGDVLPA